ncbi:response regulator [Niabella insulamsoli]|uniref:response regulator n=1 Tax=Niabella insulamsoli TaxID=3144874 RepID=UPI0031FC8FA4
MYSNANKSRFLIIIDDSKFDRKINAIIADRMQLFKEVALFPAAGEALDFIVKNLENPELFPLVILLDIQMPEMDGFEFTNEYEKLPLSFKQKSDIIMISSTDDIADIERAASNKNIRKLIKKPLKVDELRQLLDELNLHE